MRKVLILALVVMALSALGGTAAAESGGTIPPIRAMSFGGR